MHGQPNIKTHKISDLQEKQEDSLVSRERYDIVMIRYLFIAIVFPPGGSGR